jgi:hypothetical protein
MNIDLRTEISTSGGTMKRRDFLKSLIAIGAAVAIPLNSIALAPDSVIDAAWKSALENPQTFYVSEYGAISTSAGQDYSISRIELFGLDYVVDRPCLICFAENEWRVASLIEDAFVAVSSEVTQDDWEIWLAETDAATIDHLLSRVNAWLDDSADEYDWEKANLRGYSDRGAALAYFRDQFPENDLFNIVIVEGDHPGSSYFAAELRIDIAKANARAVAHGIPIRFARED